MYTVVLEGCIMLYWRDDVVLEGCMCIPLYWRDASWCIIGMHHVVLEGCIMLYCKDTSYCMGGMHHLTMLADVLYYCIEGCCNSVL